MESLSKLEALGELMSEALWVSKAAEKKNPTDRSGSSMATDVVADDPSRRRWEDIDGDLLSEIFVRLDLHDRLLSVPLVCKPWKRASLLPRCWRVLDFHESYEALVQALLLAHGLRSVTFSGLLKLLLPRAQGSVTHLFLPPGWQSWLYEWSDEEDLTALANKTRLSQPAAGNYYRDIAADLWTLSCETVDCEEVPPITPEDLEVLSIECPRLRLIVIPSSISKLGWKMCEIIGRWKELECCVIGGETDYARKLLAHIGNNCKSFETLQLIRGSRFDDTPVMHAEVASALVEYTPNLKRLYLWGFQVHKEDLLNIMRGCKHLHSLSILDCVGFESDDEEILSYGRSIRCFTCKHCETKEGQDYDDDDDDDGHGGSNYYNDQFDYFYDD